MDRPPRRPRRRRLRRVPAPKTEAGLDNQCWKDSWNSIVFRDGRLAAAAARDLRDPGLRLRRQGPLRPARPGGLERRRPGGAPREGGGRPEAPLQPGLLGGRRRVLRARAGRREAPGRHADLQHRPPALERHRRRPGPPETGSAPDGPAAVLRLGGADDGRGRGRLQPDRVPQRHRLAARHRPVAAGPGPVRRPGARRGSASPVAGLPTSSSAGCRRSSPAIARDRDRLSRRVPDGLTPQAWASGAPLLRSGRCSGSMPSAIGCGQTRGCRSA